VRFTPSAPYSLFLRLLGVVYFVAFASLAVQIVGLIGHDGILPTATLSDTTLRLLCWGGALVSLLLVGGASPAEPILVVL